MVFKSSSKAFTLIELLIVMGLLMILMSIVFPSFRGFNQEAQLTRAQGDLRVIRIAIESYYKNKDRFPDKNAYMNDLLSAKPTILENNVCDPFNPIKNSSYGYDLSSNNASIARYYVVYSVAKGSGGCEGYEDRGYASVDENGIVTLYNDVVIWISNGRLP